VSRHAAVIIVAKVCVGLTVVAVIAMVLWARFG